MKTNRVNPDIARVQGQLKKLLKSRGWSYQTLAKKINYSESGVKKLLGGKDLSIVRLGQICNALEINLVEFMQSLEQREFENTHFSPEQQIAFLKDPELFLFYWKLVFERCPLHAAVKELQISTEKSHKLLLNLDRIKAIELGQNNKIYLPRLRAIRSFGDGELIRTVYREWGQALLEQMSAPPQHTDGYFLLRGIRLRPETLKALLQTLRDVEDEFINHAIREMKIYPYSELTPVSWVSALTPKSFVDIKRHSRSDAAKNKKLPHSSAIGDQNE